jgi:hypothetical protein
MATARLQIITDERGLQSIDRLQSIFRLRSRAAVVDLGISLLEYAAKAEAKGMEVGARGATGQFERVVLGNALLAAETEPVMADGTNSGAPAAIP